MKDLRESANSSFGAAWAGFNAQAAVFWYFV